MKQVAIKELHCSINEIISRKPPCVEYFSFIIEHSVLHFIVLLLFTLDWCVRINMHYEHLNNTWLLKSIEFIATFPF